MKKIPEVCKKLILYYFILVIIINSHSATIANDDCVQKLSCSEHVRDLYDCQNYTEDAKYHGKPGGIYSKFVEYKNKLRQFPKTPAYEKKVQLCVNSNLPELMQEVSSVWNPIKLELERYSDDKELMNHLKQNKSLRSKVLPFKLKSKKFSIKTTNDGTKNYELINDLDTSSELVQSRVKLHYGSKKWRYFTAKQIRDIFPSLDHQLILGQAKQIRIYRSSFMKLAALCNKYPLNLSSVILNNVREDVSHLVDNLDIEKVYMQNNLNSKDFPFAFPEISKIVEGCKSEIIETKASEYLRAFQESEYFRKNKDEVNKHLKEKTTEFESAIRNSWHLNIRGAPTTSKIMKTFNINPLSDKSRGMLLKRLSKVELNESIVYMQDKLVGSQSIFSMFEMNPDLFSIDITNSQIFIGLSGRDQLDKDNIPLAIIFVLFHELAHLYTAGVEIPGVLALDGVSPYFSNKSKKNVTSVLKSCLYNNSEFGKEKSAEDLADFIASKLTLSLPDKFYTKKNLQNIFQLFCRISQKPGQEGHSQAIDRFINFVNHNHKAQDVLNCRPNYTCEINF